MSESIIQEINDLIISAINKNDIFYKALWGDEEFIPEVTIEDPNDFNCGAIANELEYLYLWIREITSIDINDIPAPYIYLMIYFFTQLKPFTAEDKASVLSRAFSLLIREGDWRSDTWGTPWDIKNVLGYYMDRDSVYYVGNMVVTDLIVNGGFEAIIGSEWTFSPSGNRSSGDSFTGDYKVDFTSINTVSQTITGLTSGDHVLNYFARMISGTQTGVSIQRVSDNFYWNADPSVLAWGSPSVINENVGSVSDKYQYHDVLFNMAGSDDVIITFHKVSTDVFYLDRVQMGRLDYPAFQIVYIDPGVAEGFAAMWDTVLYPENASYIDQAYMYYAQLNLTETYYDTLVKQLAAAGVYAEFSKEE